MVRHANEDVLAKEFHALVLRQDLLLRPGVLGETLDEGVQTLAGQRARGKRDLVAFADGDVQFRRDDHGLIAVELRPGAGAREEKEQNEGTGP